MPSKISLMLLCLFLTIAQVNGQDTGVITPENVDELIPLSTLESSYLGEIAWSSDSNWLAAGTSHKGVQVFDSGNLDNPALQIAGGLDILFNPDSRALASAGVVWDITTQQALLTYGAVDYKIFSPDGRYFVTAVRGAEQTNFVVYDLSTYTELYSFDFQTPVTFYRLIFSQDSSRFALLFQNTNPTIEANSFIQVREAATATLLANFDLDYPEVDELVFSNEGQYLVADNFETSYGALPSKVLIWNIAQQSRLREFDTYDRDPLLSPDGKWFFVSDFNTPYLINLDTVQNLDLLIDEGMELDLWGTIQFSMDGQYLAMPYSDFQGDVSEYGIAVWSIEPTVEFGLSLSRLILDITMSPNSLSNYAFSPDGQLLAISYGEETLLWDIDSASIQEIIPATGGIRFMPDSNEIQVGNNLWNSETDSLTSLPAPANLSPGFYAPLASPNGNFTVSHSSDSLKVQNYMTGEVTILPILDNYLGKVEYMNAESGIAVFKGTVLHAYDLHNQQELLSLDPAPYSFIMSDDGSILVAFYQSQSNTSEYAASIYHLREENANPITLNTIISAGFGFDAAISSDNQYLLVAETDGQDKPNRTSLYSIETGGELASWSEDSVSVYGVHTLFSPDSQYILTMATERSADYEDNLLIKIWELSELLNGEIEARRTIHIANDYVYDYDISFNQFDNQLVVMTDDASLGDGPAIHSYYLGFYDWDVILETTGIDPDANLNPVLLRGAHDPAFNSNSSLLLTRGTGWSRDYGQSIEYLILWDMENTSEPAHVLEGFIAGEFNSDAPLLAGLSTDGKLVFWDVADLSEENPSPIFSLDIPDIRSFEFNPDGSLIYIQTTYSVNTLGVRQ